MTTTNALRLSDDEQPASSAGELRDASNYFNRELEHA